MSDLFARPLVLAAFLFCMPALGMAQVRPTPQQAERLLQTRPDLVAQLRQRIITSGMTVDQVRARLRAEGYPENLLDPYLPNASASSGVAPGSNVFDAVRALGIVDSTDYASLQST